MYGQVAGIVGRADLLCCLFYFLSLLTYTERRRGRVGGVLAWTGSMVCCVVAMLCKEQGVTVLGVGALYDVVVTAGFRLGGGGSGGAGLWRSGRWRTLAVRLAAAAAVGLSLLYGRWIVMGSAPPAFQKVSPVPPSLFPQQWPIVSSSQPRNRLTRRRKSMHRFGFIDWNTGTSTGALEVLGEPSIS